MRLPSGLLSPCWFPVLICRGQASQTGPAFWACSNILRQGLCELYLLSTDYVQDNALLWEYKNKKETVLVLKESVFWGRWGRDVICIQKSTDKECEKRGSAENWWDLKDFCQKRLLSWTLKEMWGGANVSQADWHRPNWEADGTEIVEGFKGNERWKICHHRGIHQNPKVFAWLLHQHSVVLLIIKFQPIVMNIVCFCTTFFSEKSLSPFQLPSEPSCVIKISSETLTTTYPLNYSMPLNRPLCNEGREVHFLLTLHGAKLGYDNNVTFHFIWLFL